jgi:hypothetical protein
MLLGSGDTLRNSLAVILENIRPIIETLPLEQAADAYEDALRELVPS